jgi:NhaP-type Na+/H+ or K+/H+ antiporter
VYEHAIIALAGIGLLGIACQWFAWWVKLPAILFLLLVGIVAGPLTGWLRPDALFGDLLFPIVSLSVAVILFEGGLTLRLNEIRGLETVVRRMLTSGLLITWLVTTGAARWLLEFSWPLAFLFGALTVVTGPTVIIPMLRTVRPNPRIANILRWEGIMIDPIGALLAVLVFDFIVSGQGGTAFGHTLVSFGRILAVGLLAGALFGFGLGIMLRRHWLPEYLHNVASLSLVFTVFAGANALQPESGLLAVTIMGLWLANMRDVPVEDILDFKESLSVLLISGLFIILAARMDLSLLGALGWGAAGVLAAIQFVARPAKVLISTWGSALSWRERTLLGWVAPRGIVAAAVAALFALRLQEHGYPDAALLVPLTFLIIIGTVVLQSASARLLAVSLDVAEPEPKGFLVIGANTVARAIAKALCDKGFRTLLSDTNWEHIREARMEGRSTYYGNAVSEHADRHLDLVGIGRLLALSPQREVNALAAMRYRTEFGAQSVALLAASKEKDAEDKARAVVPGVPTLFGEDVTYAKLASLLSQGAQIHDTHLTDEFDFHAYQSRYSNKAIPLFAVGPRGQLRTFFAGDQLEPGAGWTIMGLIPKQEPESEDDGDQPPEPGAED